MRRTAVLMAIVALVATFAIPAGAEESVANPPTAPNDVLGELLEAPLSGCDEIPRAFDEAADHAMVCLVESSKSIPGQLRADIARAAAHGRRSIEYPFGESGGSKVVLKYEPAKGSPGLIQPLWTVGVGWNIYLYLNRSDMFFLIGLGTTAASATLCFWLTASLGATVACAVAGYIAGHYLSSAWAPPSGYCREFKFYYWGTFRSTKLVQRNC